MSCSEWRWIGHEQQPESANGTHATVELTGDGNLSEAVGQVARFLALDIDGRGWPDVATRDPVIADAQRLLPELRPCGFYAPYEAAAWAVLSQRIRITRAARLRTELVERHGEDGAFPAPQDLRGLHLDLLGRQTEYLYAVADAALEGRLDGPTLRSLDPSGAIESVQKIKGLGPFGAELVILGGANHRRRAPQRPTTAFRGR